MTERDILRFRDMLLERRSEIIARIQQLAAGWQALREPAIELEEEAQKVGITEAYSSLDQSGKAEIENIDLALSKMFTGDYGICEACGDDIAYKRLEALPASRLCVDCARQFEKQRKSLPSSRQLVATSAKLPDEYRGLTTRQLLDLVQEQIEKDGRVETEELDISIQNGVIFLDGTIPNEPEREILLSILTDNLGFSSIVDRLGVNELMWDSGDDGVGLHRGGNPFERHAAIDPEM